MKQLIAISLIVLSLVLAATIAQDTYAISKKDKKARDNIMKSIGKAVEGKYSTVKVVKIRKAGTSVYVVTYNTTKVGPLPNVTINKAPIAKISVSKLSANVSDLVQVTGQESSDPDGSIASYNWTGANFTDNTKQSTDFTFPNESKVVVGLTVKDNKNATAHAALEVHQWTPTSEPFPANTTASNSSIIFVGDVESTTVRDAILKQKPNLDMLVAIGDLGYDSDLKWFKAEYGDVFGEELQCTVGNHDAAEDGSPTILKEALAFCGDHWYQKVANGTTIVIGFNSNGKASDEAAYVKSIVGDPGIMKSVKTVILVSHKGGNVPPNSHHPAEAAAIYNAIGNIPGKTVIQVNAHNHVLAEAPAKNWFISGAGGRSHYSCGTNSIWTFCNGTSYGYLEFVIDNSNGEILKKAFYDTSGKIITK